MVVVVEAALSSEPDDPDESVDVPSPEPPPDVPLLPLVDPSCEASVVVSPEPELPEPDLLESSFDACSPPPDEPLWLP